MAIQSPGPLLSSLAFTRTPKPRWISSCFVHRLQADHYHYPTLCGNHSIKRNLVCPFPRMTRRSMTGRNTPSMPQLLRCPFFRRFRGVFSPCIICICRVRILLSLMALLSCRSTVFALHSMDRLRPIYLNATLGLSSTTITTHMFGHFRLSNSHHALGSLISCDIVSPSMVTGSLLTLAFQA